MEKTDNESVNKSPEKRKKIIYVDDVRCSLESVKSRLSKNYEVFLAQSAPKMFNILDRIMPDLILLDLNMPDVDGYETISSLKADRRYAHIPVIFLTGDRERESLVKGLSLGAIDFVIKPFDTTELIEIIENELNPEKNKKTIKGENKKPSVLVVDDVVSMLRTIQYALHDRYKVFTLSKSEEVLDFLEENKPDLILLDYLMPVLSGLDLIPMIKALPEYKNTPIIIITTEGTQEHVNEAISLGASDFIVKPFRPKELSDKITKHIRIAKEMQKIRKENED